MNLKISVSLNRIPPAYNILDDFEKARQYHLKHGVDITWSFHFTDLHGYTSGYDGKNWHVQNAQNIVQLDPACDINMFVFDQAEWVTPPGSPFPLQDNTPTGNCFNLNGKPFINIGRFISPDPNLIAHELMHALGIISNLKGFPLTDVMDTYYLNSNWDAPTGNFAQMWALLIPYLKSLTIVNPWIYFKATEPTGGGHTVGELDKGLVDLLDKARGIAGIPFKITSGKRTVPENDAVGGKPNSSHLLGLAVDLSCTDASSRFIIRNALLKVGFVRFETAAAHLHVDISKTLPQGVDDFTTNA